MCNELWKREICSVWMDDGRSYRYTDRENGSREKTGRKETTGKQKRQETWNVRRDRTDIIDNRRMNA